MLDRDAGSLLLFDLLGNLVSPVVEKQQAIVNSRRQEDKFLNSIYFNSTESSS
jgi:hypothetical protein